MARKFRSRKSARTGKFESVPIHEREAGIEVISKTVDRPKTWRVGVRLRDGRTIALKVRALNQVEAAQQVRAKFPLVEIRYIRRADRLGAGRAVGRGFRFLREELK